jgi:cellulose synthase/poly-beta-1,6-N-acetylglucosamine synthase-like glycosyltransferase
MRLLLLLPFVFAILESGINAVAIRSRNQRSEKSTQTETRILKTGFSIDASERQVSLIIVAYLPNEAQSLPKTIETFLTTVDWPGEPHVILTCNGAQNPKLKRQLDDLVGQYGAWLQICHHPTSRSKAENLNLVKNRVNGQIVGVFDADSTPSPNLVKQAINSFSQGASIVQGSKLIMASGRRPSILRKLVTYEALLKSFRDAPARKTLWHSAYISGSNCFFKRDIFQKLSFSELALTEDIQISFHLLCVGIDISIDPRLIVYESAPPNWPSWFHQRLRWAAGWLQIGGQMHLARSAPKPVGFRERTCWAYLIFGRRLLPGLGLCLGLFITAAESTFSIAPIETWRYYLGSLLGFLFLAVIGQLIVLAKSFRGIRLDHAPGVSREPIVGIAIALTFYEILKCLIAVIALVRPPPHWRVTPRPQEPSSTFAREVDFPRIA